MNVLRRLLAPMINDVTTCPDAPPSYRALAEVPANHGRDLSYPVANAAIQRRAYPDLDPIAVGASAERALATARSAALDLGWDVVAVDQGGSTLEATATTRLLRFVDDVVVRVRATDTGAIIDVRSKSRLGRGDLGTNAVRIRAFRERVLALLG
ncbi:MAG TPA: DUF1499 domain-containing protein [Polyangiaceae bacterium]|nr:DUF1499 domain-containing protein [Polyangiaceae bacterium]